MKVESLPGEAGNIAAEDISRSPGGLLRQERSRRGLKKMEVAERLHITKHYVNALESDNYEKLPGDIFARGYLKKYAELLELDADQIVILYNRIVSEKSRERGNGNGRNRNKLKVMWILFSAIAVVFLGLVIWLYGIFSRENSAPSEPQVNYQTDKGIIQGAFSIGLGSEEDNKTSDATELLTNINSASKIRNERSMDPLGNHRGVLPSKISLRPDVSAEEVGEPASVMQSVKASLNASLSVHSGGSDILLVSFEDQSWIEVIDSSERRIYRDLRSSGDVIEIMGKAPFDIFIGEAAHTHLIFNGDRIDVSSNIRIDHSARFFVGN